MSIDVDQLKAAYELEKHNRHPPVTADDVPFTYEDITDEWLTTILCGQHPGAKVTGHRLDVADDGNSNRRRIFIELNDVGKKAGLPDRVFCKASQGLANRISLGPPGANGTTIVTCREGKPCAIASEEANSNNAENRMRMRLIMTTP